MNREERFSAILLMGMPGTGKGTQGELLDTMQGLVHVSTGEIFRSLDPDSDDGRNVLTRIDRGEYATDDDAIRIWKRWLNDQIAAGKFQPQRDVLVMDGIPRSPAQCEILKDHVNVLAVIHLVPPGDEAIIDRLLKRATEQGRPDDANEALIRKRLAIYRERTAPILSCYDEALIHAVDPVGTVMEVNKRILEIIIPRLRVRTLASC